MKKINLILLTVIILIGVILASSYYLISINRNRCAVKMQEIKKSTEEKYSKRKIDAIRISYIGCSKSECIIPKASGLPTDSELICLWSYTGGNASIPWLVETKGWLPSINYNGDKPNDLSVLCRDTNGLVYFGKEGVENQ